MSEAATAHASIVERVLNDYRSIAADLPGDAGVRATRARAAARLAELGWPSPRDEQFRYTNLRAFERLKGFRPPAAESAPAAALAALQAQIELPAPLPGFERLIFLDGRRIDGGHPMLAAPAEQAAAPTVWPAEQRLGLLGDMFASDAARLKIRGEAAIEILFVSSARAAGAASYPRIELRLEPNSRLRLVERHLGVAASAALIACNLTIELAHHAELSHYRLQQCSRDSIFADTLSARLDEQARYAVRSIAVGAGSARTSASVQLAGRGAALAWAAIAVGRGEQVHDIALRVEHSAPDTSTEELFRGIADERARVAFSGHIQIDASAPGSQARQSLRGLIEASAEIDLRPRLEILTDDVRATHGATTGRLDEDLLFYLLARGIDRATARALLKWAFLGEVLRAIELPGLRAEAERLAAGQLPDVPILGAPP
jgi:Fe-S cluster assembly protein SufD